MVPGRNRQAYMQRNDKYWEEKYSITEKLRKQINLDLFNVRESEN